DGGARHDRRACADERDRVVDHVDPSATRASNRETIDSTASAGMSVTLTSSRSAVDTSPSSSIRVRIQSSIGAQYPVSQSTTGKLLILPVWISVSDSNSSSTVPKPPGKMTNPCAYFTSMVLRTKKERNSCLTATKRFTACSNGSSMLSPTEVAPAARAPRLAA